jgi:hypothetical protein
MDRRQASVDVRGEDKACPLVNLVNKRILACLINFFGTGLQVTAPRWQKQFIIGTHYYFLFHSLLVPPTVVISSISII